MADGSLSIPRTISEFADRVRALRMAQRRVIWAQDKTARRQRVEQAMHLGRRMDLLLDLMSAYEKQKSQPLPIPSLDRGSR